MGGAERLITSTIPLHIKNGYEVDLLLLDGVESFFLRELKNQKVKIFFLGLQNNILNPFLIFRIARRMRMYDIVHVHLFPSLYLVAFAKIFSNSKVRLVYTEHATHNRRRDLLIFKLIDKFIYRQYDHIIAISQETNSNLKSHIGSDYKITTVNNGVNLDNVITAQSSIASALKLKYQTKNLLVQVASFRAAKDQDTLIRALCLLPENFHVLFIGEGKRMEYCKNLALNLGVSKRITFLGTQNNIGAFLKISKMLIISSHWEGFGLCAIEGMAVGKPVVASNVSGLSSIVKDAGLLFEAGNEVKLVKQILSLFNDDKLYNETANKCLIRAKKYSIHKMIEDYEKIYKRLKARN
ncbi:MAG: glycosyltransferase family 4 protein [Flavobacteriaceae bacterium]